MRPQTRVDRFLSSPERVDVGMIGGEAGGHLGTFGNGAMAGDHDIDVTDGLTQPVERCLVGSHLIGLVKVEERDSLHGLRQGTDLGEASMPPQHHCRSAGPILTRKDTRRTPRAGTV
ncbi:hypothetical protein [Streptomyces sp. NPDC048256]|uniref:hypothetical protein n=1 Tax=unclassified Streptomyces TaxID=2593676 RepID=UPI0033C3D7FA